MIPQEEITYKIKLYDAITYIAPMAEIDYILRYLSTHYCFYKAGKTFV